MRTSDDISTSIYRYVTASPLRDAITGSIYNGVDRPHNADREDIVVKVIANITAQKQLASVNVNVYVPDILRGVDYVQDGDRLPYLERMSIDVLERFFTEEGALVVMESQTTMPSISGREHVINNNLNYQFINV